MKTIVVALGGNALVWLDEKPSFSNQFHHVSKALENLLPLFHSNHRLVITHGNGPQVGNILIQIQSALKKAYSVPLEAAVAESQGEIGYVIEQALYNLFLKHKIKRSIVNLLTQVVVNPKDSAFRNPTKPIGPFFSKSHALQLKKKGLDIIEDSGRGWRQIVASPKPLAIIEQKTIQELIRKKIIVICAGGGGIPVVRTKTGLKGVAAVIDKDSASQVLANAIRANELIILTGVDHVFLNYTKTNQKKLSKLSISDAKKFLKQGQFAEGSMKPKIEAAIAFLQNGGKRVLITSPRALKQALKGKNGTWLLKTLK